MLKSFIEDLEHSALKRHLLFAVATFVTVIFVGYHFGTFDQVVHIPFLKNAVDPTLYPSDPFLAMRAQHYSYFWFLFFPFQRMGILEPTLFVTHLIATYLTFWGLWEISRVLFSNALVSFLTVVAFVVPHITFGGFPIIEFSLLNRTFVLPFLLFAITLYLKKHYVWAYLLLGVLFNFHVVSVNFVLAMLGLDTLLQIKKIGWRTLFAGMGVFLITAAPVLWWRISSHTLAETMPLDPDWFTIIAQGYFCHLFHIFKPHPHIILMTLSGFSSFVLFAIARHYFPRTEITRTLTNFNIAVLIIVGVEIITATWLPITLILQLQIIRAGLFATLLNSIYFIGYLVQRFQKEELATADFALAITALISGITPLVAVFTWLAQHFSSPSKWQRRAIAAGLALTAGVSLMIALLFGVWTPGIYIYGLQSPWNEAQHWARENTPKDALFMVPPQKWWLDESTWRVFSERGMFVSLADLLEIALVPDNLPEWRTRFELVAPGVIDTFNGDYFTNKQRTREAFYTLSNADHQRIAADYDISYLVVEKPHTYEFPLVYENEGYLIYDLTAQP